MNIAATLKDWALHDPFKKAIILPSGRDRLSQAMRYSHLTYRDLESASNRLASILQQQEGLQRGDKVLLFLKASLDFPIIVFALFKIGAIPVLIDPGMGLKSFLRAIESVAPDYLMTLPKGWAVRCCFPWAFRSLKKTYSTKKLRQLIGTYGAHTFTEHHFVPASMRADETAAILFTSGGTGIPKGVVYNHALFFEQVHALRSMFKLTENDIDMPGFPFFCLFTLTMGMTVVLADIDPTRPALAPADRLVQSMLDHAVTFAGGSPAIWERVATYCLMNNLKLPTLKSLAMFGAPVRLQLHQMYSEILTAEGADTYTPYGATECLPLTNIRGSTILKEAATQMREGKGTLLGRPLANIEIKIIEDIQLPEEKIISSLKEVRTLGAYEVGEIIVSGPIVTSEYFQMPIKTALAKIRDDQGKLWHRIGDVGYLDEHGRLWFCGRRAHVVQTQQGRWFSIPCEAIFNQHSQIKRSALIGYHGQKSEPSIVVERLDGRTRLSVDEKLVFEKELRELAEKYSHTKGIKQFFYAKRFPVDIRHNIKIDRLKLRDHYLKV